MPLRVVAWGSAALVACALFWHCLAASPYLRGFDAYYYAVQADFWFRTGRLRIPDSSAVLYVIGALQYLGISAEAAVRLWVALSLVLFYATFALLLTRCRSSLLAAILFAWALVSPSIAFVAVELPKTFAVMVLMNAALFLATAERIRWGMLLVVLALAVACHKMALAYVAVLAAVLALRAFGGRFGRRGERWLGRGLVAIMLAALVAAFLAGTLGRADLLRLQGGNMMPGLLSLLMQPGLPGAVAWEVGIAALLAVGAFLRGRGGADCGLALLLLLTAFVPAFGSEPLSFGERFGLLFPYWALVSCALLLRKAKAFSADAGTGPAQKMREAKKDRGTVRFGMIGLCSKVPGGLLLASTVLLAALAAAPFRLAYSYPDKINPPYERYAAITEELAGRGIPMLILHRGMHFYYKYATRRDAFSYEPEAHWNRRRIWRLVYGATPEELFANTPASCAWGSEVIPLRDRDYTLMREDCFAAMRGAVDNTANSQLHALLWQSGMNPSKPRPAFLYGKHADDEADEFPALPPDRSGS